MVKLILLPQSLYLYSSFSRRYRLLFLKHIQSIGQLSVGRSAVVYIYNLVNRTRLLHERRATIPYVYINI